MFMLIVNWLIHATRKFLLHEGCRTLRCIFSSLFVLFLIDLVKTVSRFVAEGL